MEEECRFYVYVYLDNRKPGEYKYGDYTFDYCPFYVGKGSKWRMNEHLYEANHYRDKKDGNKYGSPKCNVIRKIIKETGSDPVIIKIKENLSDEEAFTLEEDLIKLIGRMNLKTGPLTNYTDGGNGVRSFVFTDEYRKRLGKISKEINNRPEVKEKNRQAQLKRFKDPKERARCSEYQKEIQNRPDVKVRSIEHMKKNNPMYVLENKLKCIESVKKFNRENPEKVKERTEKIRKILDTPEHKKMLSEKMKKQWEDPEFKDKMLKLRKGFKHSAEAIEKMRIASTGRIFSEETRQKIRNTHQRPEILEAKRRVARGNKNCCKKYIIIKPDSSEIECSDLKPFCTENNLKLSTMYGIANGYRKCTANGFRCYKEGEKEKMYNLWKQYDNNPRGSDKYKYYLVTSPTGEESKIKGLSIFCKENDLSKNGMYLVASGKQEHHRGWIVRRI